MECEDEFRISAHQTGWRVVLHEEDGRNMKKTLETIYIACEELPTRWTWKKGPRITCRKLVCFDKNTRMKELWIDEEGMKTYTRHEIDGAEYFVPEK